MAGRPTKLTKALVAKARKYVEGDWRTGREIVVPTIEGLALHLHIARSTVYEWMEVPSLDLPEGLAMKQEDYAKLELERDCRQQFSDIANDLLTNQAQLLMQNGLRGTFNPSITKLILSGKHGYVEKHEQSGDQRVTVEIQKYSEDQPPA